MMSPQKFTESIILSIPSGKPTEEVRYGKCNANINISISGNHMLAEAEGPKQKSRKRCRGCYEKTYNNKGFEVAVNKAEGLALIVLYVTVTHFLLAIFQ
jgi:hypothetical protein